MALIKIRGEEAIEIDYSAAVRLRTAWQDKTIKGDTIFDLPNGMSVQKSEIKWINTGKFNDSPNPNASHQSADESYQEYRRGRLAVSPEDRGKSTDMFELLFYCTTKKKEVPIGTLKLAVERQQKFFSENPKRTICNPEILKDLFPEIKKGKDDEGNVYHVLDFQPKLLAGGMRMIERVLAEDIYWSRRS